MKTLTLITPRTMGLDPEELAKREPLKEFPRVSLFRKTLNSDLLDERFLAGVSSGKKALYRVLPVSVVQVLEAYSILDQYDAVISWAERLGIPLATLMKMTGKRVPHIAIFSWISRFKKSMSLRYVQSHFDRLILTSSKQRDFALRDIGLPEKKVTLLKWPVDQEFWTPVESTSDTICAVGREMRDYQTLLDSLDGLPIRCHIAAGGITLGKKDAWMRDLGGKVKLSEYVTVGRLPFIQLRELYGKSRFVVIPLLPTETDNGSTTILEAMAMGKAVICSKVEGQKDILRDGVTGIFVPPSDPRAMREAIEYLWNNPHVAQRMGREGRKFIEEHHGLDSFVNSIRSITEECIEDFKANSFKRSIASTEIRTLTLVSRFVPRRTKNEARSLQQDDKMPRVLLYEDTMHSVILGRKGFVDTPLWRRFFYSFLPFPLAKSIEAFVVRKQFDMVVCWSARTTLMFATILKLTRTHYPTIALLTWVSAAKKANYLRFVHPYIDRIVMWSSVQRDYAIKELKIPASKIKLVSRRVDHEFWRPMDVETDMICSAGQEMRDFPTLIESMKGLDIKCHIATGALSGELFETVKAIRKYRSLPSNIMVSQLRPFELRKLYARSRFVVVPLLPTDTDNGVTTIEEAMAMGKAVICSRTVGQVDVMLEGETGLFVPVGDAEAMRAAIQYLWENPEVAERMGKRGRAHIVEHHTLDKFVGSLKTISEEVVAEYTRKSTGVEPLMSYANGDPQQI